MRTDGSGFKSSSSSCLRPCRGLSARLSRLLGKCLCFPAFAGDFSRTALFISAVPTPPRHPSSARFGRIASPAEPQHLLAPDSYVRDSAKLAPLIALGARGVGNSNSAAFDALIPSLNHEFTLNKHVDSYQSQRRELGANSARLAPIRRFQVFVFLSEKKQDIPKSLWSGDAVKDCLSATTARK